MQKYLTVVSAVLTDAKRNEIIQKNPARMIDLPLTRRTTQYIPSPVEIQKLLDVLAKEPRHYRMFYLLFMCTGCRRGELCALKWEDFKFSRGSLLLTISRSRSVVPGKGVVEGATKNGRSREIVLSSDLRGFFMSYRRRKADGGPAGASGHDCCFRRNSFFQENCDSFADVLAVCCACKISLNCTEVK